MDLKQICLQAAEVSKKAGAFIRKEAGTFDSSRIEQKGLNDLVSYVDKEAEKIIVEGLRAVLPEAGFITEEGTVKSAQGKEADKDSLIWVIDPLDGTTNFIHKIPVYAVSIGLLQGGKVIAGVVYEINKDECFYAWQGGGAYCNGKKIEVSKVEHLDKSLVISGFPYQDFGRQDTYLRIFKEFMKKSHGIRRLGSAATDLAYVAAGRGEGFFEYNLKPWDVAGGVILVQEAGGVVTTFSGGDDYVFTGEILAAGKVHGQMKDLINQFW
jgi:myo-inositol-1(or 4)-monophosphatase